MKELRNQLEELISEIEGYKSLNQELSSVKDLADKKFAASQMIIKSFEGFTSEIGNTVNETLTTFSNSAEKSKELMLQVKNATNKYEDLTDGIIKLFKIQSEEATKNLSTKIDTSRQSIGDVLDSMEGKIEVVHKLNDSIVKELNSISTGLEPTFEKISNEHKDLNESLLERHKIQTDKSSKFIKSKIDDVHKLNGAISKELDTISSGLDQMLKGIVSNTALLEDLKLLESERYESNKESIISLKEDCNIKHVALSYDVNELTKKFDSNAVLTKVALLALVLNIGMLFYLCFFK